MDNIQQIIDELNIDEQYHDDVYKYIEKHYNYETLKNIYTDFDLKDTSLPIALKVIEKIINDENHNIELTLNKGDEYDVVEFSVFNPRFLEVNVNGKNKFNVLPSNAESYKDTMDVKILIDEIHRYLTNLSKNNKIYIYLLASDIEIKDNKLYVKSFINLKEI